MSTRITYERFGGGLDLVSAPYSAPPGSVVEAANFELAPLGGYSRIAGYERYDGQLEPHKAPGTGTAPTPLEHAEEVAGAADARRALIQPVPGDGPVRGVAVFEDEVYAFRDNVGQTECLMYKATPDGWSLVTTPELLPGGEYRFTVWNFGGAASQRKLFGCDGVNPAFSFDGTTFTQIATGMSPDTPSHIAAHKSHLFLTFDASLQHSALADPTSWTPVMGASEIALGDQITNLTVSPGDASNAALMVTTRNSLHMLYGNSSADWNLVTLSPNTGAYPSSVVAAGAVFALGRRGVVAITPNNSFANFAVSSLSQRLQPWVEARGPQVRGAAVAFARNQVVWHFGAGQALTTTIGPEGVLGFMPLKYAHTFVCFCSASLTDGSDMMLAGGDDGYVYRLGVGTSFDGLPIAARLRLVPSGLDGPRTRKRFRKAVIESTAEGWAEFRMSAQYDFGDPDVQDFTAEKDSLKRSTASWDVDSWDAFFFDSRPASPLQIKMEGSGEMVSLFFYSETNLSPRFTLHGSILHFEPRKLMR